MLTASKHFRNGEHIMTDLNKIPEYLEVPIERMTHQGEGIARSPGGKIIFIPGALPEEKVRLKILEEKKDYARGKVLEVLKAQELRTDPPCPWYGECGGCQLQHAAYPLQLQLKTEMVRGALQRLGKLEPLEEPAPCVASPKAWGYRNKAAFPVQARHSGKGAITGFYRERSHRLVRIRKCRILPPGLNELYRKMESLVGSEHLPGYSEEKQRGFLRHILLRETASSLGITLLVGASPSKRQEEWIRQEIGGLLNSVDKMGHLSLGIQREPGNSLFAEEYRSLKGSGEFRERLQGMELAFPMNSFFQVNTSQAEQLFSFAAEYAAQSQPESIVELYAGVGALTVFLAPHTKKLQAVEFGGSSVAWGRKNMETQGFSHVTFAQGDAGEFLSSQSTPPDMLYLDPPRKGCEPPVLQEILKLMPRQVVYISCNPATLARDLRVLCDGGYTFRSYRPFDMFPQTAHVETVALLEKA
jgi:23S rRNA (uracil1939-C5)-methyltransferase